MANQEPNRADMPPASPMPLGPGARPGHGPAGRLGRFAPHAKPKDLRGTLRRLWGLTRGHRRGLLAVLGLSGFVAASPVLTPLVIGRIVDLVNTGGAAGALIAVLLGVYVGDWLARSGQQFVMAGVGAHIIRDIRMVLFRAMEGLPLAFFDRHQHGELMSRIANDVDNVSTTLSNSLSQLMVYAFTICGVLASMLALSVPLTLVALVSVALVFLVTKVVTKRTRPLYLKQQALLGKLNGHIEESVSGLSMVKAFGREEAMVAQFEEANATYRATATRALVWSGYLMPITNVVNNLSFVAVAVVSGLLAAQGLVGVGVISSFLLYVRQFTRPFVDIANIYNNFQSAVAGAERVFEVMDEEPEPPDAQDALPLVDPRGNIRLRHVTFGYEPGVPVLKDVSLDVAAGTRVAVVGATGSGKTTLINLLTRFYDVDSGSIELDGHDVRSYRLADLRRAFGVVLQDSSLFSLSVRDNIAYGQEGVGLEEVRAAARAAGAHAFIERLPHGYDTMLEQGGSALSQGERQLLTIARAMLADAPILILDEATSSVDTVTEQRIRAAVLAATEGRTSFVIAHRLSTVRDSDVIVVMDAGRIVEQGTHEELLAADGRYAEMWRAQTGVGGETDGGVS